MSAPVFLVPALPDGDRYLLDGMEGHHAATVTRLRPGEPLVLADGRGGTATAEVIGTGRGTVEVAVRQRRYAPPPDPRLVVVQGIAKGERGELAVQAMTEVGVDQVVPWAANRSVVLWRGERGEKSRQRWVTTAREAAKQARRSWLPEVTGAAGTAAIVDRLAKADRALVLHEEAAGPLSAVELPDSGEIVLVVGPEGGIAPEELTAFVAAGALAVRLGPTVLRTSTAGVAALSVLSARLGRW